MKNAYKILTEKNRKGRA